MFKNWNTYLVAVNFFNLAYATLNLEEKEQAIALYKQANQYEYNQQYELAESIYEKSAEKLYLPALIKIRNIRNIRIAVKLKELEKSKTNSLVTLKEYGEFNKILNIDREQYVYTLLRIETVKILSIMKIY